jgi:hypothetical protein
MATLLTVSCSDRTNWYLIDFVSMCLHLHSLRVHTRWELFTGFQFLRDDVLLQLEI